MNNNTQLANNIWLIRRLRIALLLASFIFASPLLYGSEPQPVQDSVMFSFHFRVGDALLMRYYKDNSRSLDSLDRLIREAGSANIVSVNIIGSASPEGSVIENEKLAWMRAQSIKTYIRWQFEDMRREIYQLGINLDNRVELSRAVEADHNVPNRDKVIEILQSQAPQQSQWANIQPLAGDPAGYIERTIFPRLRNAVSCAIILKTLPIEQQQEHPAITQVTDNAASAVTANPITEQADTTSSKPLTDLTTEQKMSPAILGAAEHMSKPDPKRAAIALKTNLLFDLVSAVNLEVEIPIGKRWSIAAGAVFPGWNFNNHYCVTMTEVSLEPRLWLGDREHLPSGKPRNSLTGHFVGVYGHWIESYDLQYRHNGVMGSGYGAGITYGYSHRLGRNFNMEYSIGVGALYLENKSFGVDDNYEYLILKNSLNGWKFLPTRAKISLVWLIGNKGVNRK